MEFPTARLKSWLVTLYRKLEKERDDLTHALRESERKSNDIAQDLTICSEQLDSLGWVLGYNTDTTGKASLPSR